MYVSFLRLRPHLFDKCSHIKPTSPVRLVLTVLTVLALRRPNTLSTWLKSLLLAALVALLDRLVPCPMQLSLLTTTPILQPLDRLQARLLEQKLELPPLVSRPLGRLLARPPKPLLVPRPHLSQSLGRLLAHQLHQTLALLPLVSPTELTASPPLRHILRPVPPLLMP